MVVHWRLKGSTFEASADLNKEEPLTLLDEATTTFWTDLVSSAYSACLEAGGSNWKRS